MSNQIISKKCSKCKQTKPTSDFYHNRAQKNGYGNQCKICFSESIINYQRSEKGKIVCRRKDKKYRKTDKCKAAKKLYQKTMKGKATSFVNRAIQLGNLARPDSLQCNYCLKQAKEYHHPSYLPEQWLNVIPVCKNCHIKQHKKVS